MKFAKWIAAGMLVVLAACGPAEANQAAQEAASAAGVAVPSDAAEQAASALADAESALSSAAADIEQMLNDADLEALANEAMTTVEGLTPADLRLDRDQALVLDTTKEVADVTNYRWIITKVPAGAESVRGSVIAENSNGKLTVAPDDYAKYFPVAGDYTVDLELTYSDGKKERSPIEITVP